ncbi:DUF7313 family protein [Natronomonas sp. EA1]|uniref:DUF7313 family protein n=1 Tax=Natronomonas sp. EA1 TaxID=3421655 RepID=UPI003EB7715A
MEPSVSLFGPVDAILAPYIGYVLLGLLLANIVARGIEFNQIKSQAAEGGAEAITRHPLRVATSFLLVVGTFYYMTVHQHGGVVFGTLVLAIFISDLFEFESRKVEARREIDIERPKSAIAASLLALLYILYQTLFFVIAPVWNSII